MRKLLFAILFCAFLAPVLAQKPALDKVEPMNWWVGMKNPDLQLMVHGTNISMSDVELSYPGVSLIGVTKVENPNYLFLDLKISPDAKAGKFPIRFKSGKTQLEYSYELRDRNTSSDRIQGVTSKDLIYLIMPDRFANGDHSNDSFKNLRESGINRDSMYHRHGGDLQGIMNHFDYLKELGVTAVWLTPELENDMKQASYHGYATTDHYKIDPRFGTNELYRTYVQTAHNKGLKVIKDIVHNHIGLEHWFFKDLPMKSWLNQWPKYTQTTYRDQTIMDPHAASGDRDQMLNGWFVPSMPDLNQTNPYVQNYLTQNHIWWIEYAGIDGLRLDTYPYNDPEYMADWARKVKAEFPQLSIFGETLVWSAANQAFFTGGNTVNRGFDTHLPGITDAVLKEAIYEALNGKTGWTEGVNRLYTVLSQDFLYQDANRNTIFLDNHDMSRFVSMVGEDMTKFKSGIAMLLTMRGVPQLYYGTEIFMKNFSNPDGLVRSDFPGGWEGDKEDAFTAAGRSGKAAEAWNYVSKLANYRKTSPALQTGKLIQFVPQDGVYVYFRVSDQDKNVMIIYNGEEKERSVNTARFKNYMGDTANATDVITGQRLKSDVISVPAKTALVLEIGN